MSPSTSGRGPVPFHLPRGVPRLAGGAAAMSSPSKRREMDVMKLCVFQTCAFPLLVLALTRLRAGS